MELATGRIASNKEGANNGTGRESAESSGRGGRGTISSRSGDRSYSTKPVVGDRDRDRDSRGRVPASSHDYGRERGGDRRRGSQRGGSGGGGGGGRYSSKDRGGSDSGYRSLGYHQRDRSRSPLPADRNKRPRVAGSPDSRAGGSTSSRRDGKDKDRPRSRESGVGERAGNGGGGSSGQRGGNSAGGRRLADLVESSTAREGGRGDSGSGGGAENESEGRRGNSREEAVNEASAGSGKNRADGSASSTGRRTNSTSPYANGNGKGAAGAGEGGKGSGGESGDEEGEVVFSSSASKLPSGKADGSLKSAEAKAFDSENAAGSRRGGRSPPSIASDAARRSSPRRGASDSDSSGGRNNGVSNGGDGTGSADVGKAAADTDGKDAPKKVAKDRWADSDSEEDEDGAAAGGGRTKSGAAGGEATGTAKINGALKGSATGVDGVRIGDGSAERGSGLIEGDRGESGGVDKAALNDLHRAMAGDKKGSAAGVPMGSPRINESREDASAEGDAGEGGAAGGSVGAAGGSSAYRNGGRDVPMTVFTRHEAAQDTYNPLLYGCRSVDNYQRITFIDEGAYGKVYCALNKSTGEVVALKQVKLTQRNGKEGFPITALRETNVLLSLHHPNIVRVLEMVVGSTLDKVYMVMEYFDHDLKSVMRLMRNEKRCFSLGQVKSLVHQLLCAVEYMHRHWYIHRDLKTSNLLYNHQGKLAVCDFGLARKYEEPIRPYTFDVVTLWYRCPELLLGQTTYSTGVDMWSVGCIFGELIKGSPMFMGKTPIEQLAKIFGVMGSPTETRWPGWSKLPDAKKVVWRQGTENTLRATFPATGFSGQASISAQGLDLMNGLLGLDPPTRTSAADALSHQWFKTEQPAPTPIGQMPQVDSKLDNHINEALADWTKARSKEQIGRGGR